MDRYIGEPKRLYDFMSEFDVHCPICEKKATVNLPNFMDHANAKVICHNCHFTQKFYELIRYKPPSKALCVHCGEPIDPGRFQPAKSIPCIHIKCNSCGEPTLIQENWEKIVVKHQPESIGDPIFGLPLWYCTVIKQNALWAYNLSHLLEIKNYVAARLRERTTNQYKMTMVEKLPNFVKSAKNREEILKSISRLLKK